MWFVSPLIKRVTTADINFSSGEPDEIYPIPLGRHLASFPFVSSFPLFTSFTSSSLFFVFFFALFRPCATDRTRTHNQLETDGNGNMNFRWATATMVNGHPMIRCWNPTRGSQLNTLFFRAIVAEYEREFNGYKFSIARKTSRENGVRLQSILRLFYRVSDWPGSLVQPGLFRRTVFPNKKRFFFLFLSSKTLTGNTMLRFEYVRFFFLISFNLYYESIQHSKDNRFSQTFNFPRYRKNCICRKRH